MLLVLKRNWRNIRLVQYFDMNKNAHCYGRYDTIIRLNCIWRIKMGLDISLYEVDSNATKFVYLEPDHTNKSRIRLFDKFAKFVQIKSHPVVDILATFQKVGLNYEDYSLYCTVDDRYTFNHDSDGTEITFHQDDLVLVDIEIKYLPVKSISYQRKGMNREFYTQYLAGCWYVSSDTSINEDDSLDFAIAQDELERAKQFAVDGEPIHNWKLNEMQFVEFNY